MRACAAAEEPNALEQVAGGDAGGGEDEVVARSQVLRDVHAVLVAVAHPRAAFSLLVAPIPEACLDLAAEAAQGRRGDHALGRAAGPHDRVDAGARDRAGDRRRQVPVPDELDARARLPDLGDEGLVPLALEDDDRDVTDAAAERPGDAPQVLAGALADVDLSRSDRTDAQLLEVGVR